MCTRSVHYLTFHCLSSESCWTMNIKQHNRLQGYRWWGQPGAISNVSTIVYVCHFWVGRYWYNPQSYSTGNVPNCDDDVVQDLFMLLPTAKRTLVLASIPDPSCSFELFLYIPLSVYLYEIIACIWKWALPTLCSMCVLCFSTHIV